MRKIGAVIVIITVLLAVLGTYNYFNTMDKTVIIGYLPDDHHAALFVASEKKMYEKEGIRVQIVPFTAGPEMINALDNGKIDIAYCGVSPVITAIANGSHIKIVAAVNEDGSAIVVNKNSNIKNISDLKYKTIAIPQKSSVQDVLLEYTLTKNNISSNDINIVESDVPYMSKSLLLKKFSAFIAWEPYPSAAEIDDNQTIIAYSEDLWNSHPCCVVVTTDNYAKNNPEKLDKILKIHIDATNYVNSNKDETALIVSKKLETSFEVEKESLTHVKFIVVPSNDFINNSLKMAEIQRQLGYIKNNLTQDQLFDLQYLKNII